MKLSRVYIEITNVCNLSCSFCPGTRRAPAFMTPEQFDTVCRRIRPYTKEIYLHVMGEPLLHPALESFLAIAESYGLTVNITTNGTLLSERTDLLLSHAKTIKKVSISLHSCEGNERKEAQNEYFDEVLRFCEKAAKCGIFTALRLWNLNSVERRGHNRENGEILERLRRVYPEPWQRRYTGWRIGERVFLECAEIFTWPVESEAAPRECGRCHGLLDQVAVLVDGTVVPCCLDSEGEIALGNLYGSELDQILGDIRASEMRDGLLHGRLTEPLCQKCTYANRFKKR